MVGKSSTGVDLPQKASRPGRFVPSWIDRLGAWVDRWPGSAWLYYLGLWLALFLIQSVVLWMEGAAPPGSFLVVHAYHAGAVALLLFVIHVLDEAAGKALQTLRPALKPDEEKLEEFLFRLTHLPAIGAILAGLIALLVVFILERISGTFQLEMLRAYPVSAGLFRLVYLMAWWVYGTFLFHTIHQLQLIHRIYTQETRINLFQIKPLYAFSNLSALTAGSLTVVPYGWMAVNPDATFNEPLTVIVYLLITSMAIVTFVWPLGALSPSACREGPVARRSQPALGGGHPQPARQCGSGSV